MSTTETTKVFIENKEIPWEEMGNGIRRKIMSYDDRLMLVKVEFEKGGIGSVHKHHHTQITHGLLAAYRLIQDYLEVLTTWDGMDFICEANCLEFQKQ